jgi:hypothetical protein
MDRYSEIVYARIYLKKRGIIDCLISIISHFVKKYWRKIMKKILFAIFSLFIISVSISSFSGVRVWDDYDRPIVSMSGSGDKIQITNVNAVRSNAPPAIPISFFINGNGSIYQLPWDKTIDKHRKFPIKFNTGLLIENIIADKGVPDELSSAKIYTKDWQLPINGTLLITQYKTNLDGTINYNIPPTKFALTSTSNTIMSIKWIKSGFTPVVVDEPTSNLLQIISNINVKKK